jgi:hypothetical protein
MIYVLKHKKSLPLCWKKQTRLPVPSNLNHLLIYPLIFVPLSVRANPSARFGCFHGLPIILVSSKRLAIPAVVA